MLTTNDGGRAGEMRRRHRRALEEREAGRRRTELMRNRTDHVHARSDDIRLDAEVDVGRALTREPGHDVRVRGQEVLLGRTDRRGLSRRGDQRGTVGRLAVPSCAIAVGSPATLFTTRTATAPAFWALRIFVENVHVPREMSAIFPVRLPAASAEQAVLSVPVAEVPPRTTPNGAVRSAETVAKSPAAAPGDSTVKCPGPLLPAATATTMFASSRSLTASISRSWTPCELPPRLMLATSKPSAYAASSALRMSSERAFVTSPGNTL